MTRRYVLHESEFGYTVECVEDDSVPRTDTRYLRYAPTSQEVAKDKAVAKAKRAKAKTIHRPPTTGFIIRS